MSEQLQNEIAVFNENAKALVIVDDKGYVNASEYLASGKAVQKNIDQTFDDIITKAHATHKEAIAKKKSFSVPLFEAIDKIKKIMITYKKKKDDEARTEQLRLDEIARKKADDKRLAEATNLEAQGRPEEAEAALNSESYIAPSAVESAPEVAGVSYRDKWTFAIENPELVPREYCIPDLTAIGAISRSMKGRVKIPGVRIFNDKILVGG